ncbi:branched-chain amino acid transport ATP-binding protein LivG [Halarchaeum acidiphilum MH1-52-1]|uniref:Probable branched-chain amino acid transport ATP-binding protein LivG n=1 Tax=Halarchaeum acidiphilum MH1-52-1 TaxID=1261545 RepID=U2YR44_9EURY|nr:ABC transporter ATP-binding protein [Halarchaeum acidiphilum]GAD51445.1 branched-chain amino acid transport ATP-binding protein LivG [Halarchaeum acidiphilum MH1-52-1]
MSDDAIADGPVTGKPDPVLEVRGLEKAFGGLQVTDDVDLDVERGTITGLIGPNGAGKSTLFNLVSGFYEPDGGTVRVNGTAVTGAEPHAVANAGLVRTFQTPRKLEGMTVREAMLVGPQHQTGESVLSVFTNRGQVVAEERANLERAMETLERFEIARFADTPATELSGGQMKLVELARATMTDPDILLLDEPIAGVNPTLANKLKGFIRDLNDDGITFLVIEHDMDFIMDLADPIVVLDQGSVLVEGDPGSVRTDDRVIDAYLGGPLDE